MDIFVRAIPPSSSEKDLVKFFRSYFAEFGIITYEINKFRNKPLANITILEPTKGHLFLAKYGVYARTLTPLRMNGYYIKCSVSHTVPTPIQLRTLAAESARQSEKLRDQSGRSQPRKERGATHGISSLACGVWTYKDDRLVFQPHFFDSRSGRIVFGARQAVILLQPDGQSADRIDINYYNVDTVLIGDPIDPTISLTCVCPPKFYQQAPDNTTELNALLARLNVNLQRPLPQQQPKKVCPLGVEVVIDIALTPTFPRIDSRTSVTLTSSLQACALSIEHAFQTAKISPKSKGWLAMSAVFSHQWCSLQRRCPWVRPFEIR